MELYLIIVVPILIIVGFLLLPFLIYLVTKFEAGFIEKYRRFDRINKIEVKGVKCLSFKDRWWIAHVAGAYGTTAVLVMIYKLYILSSEVYPFILCVILLLSSLLSVLKPIWKLYRKYKGYQLLTSVLWTINLMVSVMVVNGFIGEVFFIIYIPFAICWAKKTERVLILSRINA